MDWSRKIQSGITTNCKRGKVIEKDRKKIFWDQKHPTRTNCIAHRPRLTMKDTSKKMILLINIAYPKEYNKVAIQDEKIRNYP